MRLISGAFLLFLAAACAGATGGKLRPDYAFGPEDEAALLLIDVTALGDVRDRLIIWDVNLETERFEFEVPLRPLQGAIVNPQAEEHEFALQTVAPRTFALIGVERFNRPAARADCFDDRAPVFRIEEGEVGVLSLAALDLPDTPQAEPDDVRAAAAEALLDYENIEGKIRLLTPIAHIGFTRFGVNAAFDKSLCLSGRSFDVVLPEDGPRR
jgi:hypothetical protein